jgi:methylamine dehydrogenase accessory protein MauD
MMQALIVTNVLLWLGLSALAFVVAALARQVGVLHERIAPAGALMPAGGPAVGDAAPQITLSDLSGAALSVGGTSDDGRATLLFFLSPTCPVCKTLLPTLMAVSRDEPRAPRIVLASDGEPEEHRRFVAAQRIDTLPYVVSTEIGMAYAVGKLPYAVLIDADGVIRAKGIVNTREHLESLFEAERRGVATIQEYLGRERSTSQPTGERSQSREPRGERGEGEAA